MSLRKGWVAVATCLLPLLLVTTTAFVGDWGAPSADRALDSPSDIEASPDPREGGHEAELAVEASNEKLQANQPQGEQPAQEEIGDVATSADAPQTESAAPTYDTWDYLYDRALEAADRTLAFMMAHDEGRKSEPAEDLLNELHEVERLLQNYIGEEATRDEARMVGLLGSTRERQAHILAVTGAEEESVRIWDLAFETYRQGADLDDEPSLLMDGRYRLHNDDPWGAAERLRRASQLAVGVDYGFLEEAEADLHSALIDLIQLETSQTLDLLMEARQIEQRAFRAYRQGHSAGSFWLIAYNSAAFQILLVEHGRLEADQAFAAANQLSIALRVAGPYQEMVARAILEEDTNLESLRGQPCLAKVEAQARAVLESRESK